MGSFVVIVLIIIQNFGIFVLIKTELLIFILAKECNDEHPCQGLGEHAHFRNFGMAFLTLFRIATGDNWNGILKDTLRSPPPEGWVPKANKHQPVVVGAITVSKSPVFTPAQPTVASYGQRQGSREEAYCDPDPECLTNCCISPIIAPLFFVIFVLMAQFVLVNVVVAVLMKHLEESHKQARQNTLYFQFEKTATPSLATQILQLNFS
jgi:voltage-dependent calcium channel T type alpha-1G